MTVDALRLLATRLESRSYWHEADCCGCCARALYSVAEVLRELAKEQETDEDGRRA